MVVSLSYRPFRRNSPLRIRCINSMPAPVVAAFLKRLKPSIDPPRLSRRYCETIPTLDELGRMAPHPMQDRRVSKRQPSLSHHFDEIAQAELVALIPANTKNYHVMLKVTAGERSVQTFQLAHRELSNRSVRHSTRFVDRYLHYNPLDDGIKSRGRGAAFLSSFCQNVSKFCFIASYLN